jgi:SET domain-containing protein
MSLFEKQLIIKPSTIPNAGKGLFTKVFIPKGSRIIEYKGKITTWKEVLKGDTFNGYVYYVKANHVIDGLKDLKALARYANDAKGLSKTTGINNNSKYEEDGLKVFIVATKNIEAGSEILVPYGKEYWDVIKENIKADKANQSISKK